MTIYVNIMYIVGRNINVGHSEIMNRKISLLNSFSSLLFFISISLSIGVQSATWKDNFDDVSNWSGGVQETESGVLTLTNAGGKLLTSKVSLLNDFSSSVKFRAKPADGTPNYATLALHLFTDENGGYNQHSYALHMGGNRAGRFKIIRAGYDTEHLSEKGSGLLEGSGEWSEVEVRFVDGFIQVFRGTEQVLNHEVVDLPGVPLAPYITLEAKSGNWDFDWLEVDSNTGTDTGNDDNSVNDEVSENTLREEFDSLSDWQGGSHVLDGSVLTLTNADGKLLTSKVLGFERFFFIC